MAFGAKDAYAYLMMHGFNASQAAALAGNIQQESGFDPKNTNDKEGAYGLLQWRLDRREALGQFAKSTGRDVSDPYAQLDFIAHEMRNGSETKSAQGFMQAQDVGSASAALKPYIRYGDASEGARLKYAQGVMSDPPQADPQTMFAQHPGEMQPGHNAFSAYAALSHLWNGNPITVVDADGKWRMVRPVAHDPFGGAA